MSTEDPTRCPRCGETRVLTARYGLCGECSAAVDDPDCPGGHECPNYPRSSVDEIEAEAYARGISEQRRQAVEAVRKLRLHYAGSEAWGVVTAAVFDDVADALGEPVEQPEGSDGG